MFPLSLRTFPQHHSTSQGGDERPHGCEAPIKAAFAPRGRGEGRGGGVGEGRGVDGRLEYGPNMWLSFDKGTSSCNLVTSF